MIVFVLCDIISFKLVNVLNTASTTEIDNDYWKKILEVCLAQDKQGANNAKQSREIYPQIY